MGAMSEMQEWGSGDDLRGHAKAFDFILCQVGCHGKALSQAVTQSDLSLKGPL